MKDEEEKNRVREVKPQNTNKEGWLRAHLKKTAIHGLVSERVAGVSTLVLTE